jgi:beta-lactamase superfamily II metal-dependent hydrolase
MYVRKSLVSFVILVALLASSFSAVSAAKPLVITAPIADETVSGTYLVTGGGDGRSVEVSVDYVNWQPADGGKSWTYSWDTTAYSDGPHIVYARYTDLSDEKSVSVQVSNGGSGETCNVAAGEVLINEILPAPSSGAEWVELYNTTSSDVDISYCYLDDLADAGGAPVQIPSGTIIPASGFWTRDFSSYFNNTGDDVRFLREDGTTVLDAYTYGTTGYDESWYRLPDGGPWAGLPTTSPTKGTTNGDVGICGTGTWTEGNLEIHHINIGQGDAALIVGPTGKSLLFDAGETYWNSSIDAQTVGPYIETVLGCKELDYVVISHFHVDHIGYVGYGGLWHLVEVQGFTVGQTLLRDYNTYMGTTSGTYENWETYLAGDGIATLNPTTAVEGTGQVDLGGGVVFDIVTVDGNGAMRPGDFSADPVPPSENDYSIGAVLSYGLFDEWLGGDLDGQYVASEFGYVYHDVELSVAAEVGDVDVLKVNHHGSDHSSNVTFVNQLDPEVSIVSVGDDNTYGHPRQPVMDLLLATSDVYMTERGDLTTDIGDAVVAGDIVIKTSDGVNYTVNGISYVASDPTRVDSDGDNYFIEVDPDDGDPASQPAPNGGCDEVYQYCGVVVLPDPPVMTNAEAGKKSITVYWDNSQTVDYYNVYRAEVSGGPYALVASELPDSYYFWKNTGLTSGIEYFYVMTSVVGGLESGYSNEVSAVPR